MKALPPSTNISAQFEAVRLYRDDLERVLGLLKDTGLEIRIADSRFEYESVDDLYQAAGRSPRRLEIEGIAPEYRGRVTLSRSGRYWHLHSYGERTHQIAREIESIVRQRQSRVDTLPLHWLVQAGNAVLWVGLAMRARFGAVSTGLMAVGATLLVLSLGLALYWYTYPGLVLKYPHEAGFVARNRDAILLLIVGAVIGAVIGGIAQFLMSRLLKGTP